MADEQQTFFFVRATDGEEKRVQWDGNSHVLPEGGKKKLFPIGPAQHFQFYHPGAIELEPFAGAAEVVPAEGAFQCPFCDETFASFGDQTAHVKECDQIPGKQPAGRGRRGPGGDEKESE